MIDWEEVDRVAREKYAEDSTVIDQNDFIAGFHSAVVWLLGKDDEVD